MTQCPQLKVVITNELHMNVFYLFIHCKFHLFKFTSNPEHSSLMCEHALALQHFLSLFRFQTVLFWVLVGL